MRAVSLAAGFGPGYLFSVLKDDRDPSIDSAIRLCDELGISLSYLMFGVEMTRETEEILRLLENHPEARAGILQILRGTREP